MWNHNKKLKQYLEIVLCNQYSRLYCNAIPWMAFCCKCVVVVTNIKWYDGNVIIVFQKHTSQTKQKNEVEFHARMKKQCLSVRGCCKVTSRTEKVRILNDLPGEVMFLLIPPLAFARMSCVCFFFLPIS